MRRACVVCLVMVLVCCSSTFGAEPKWVWAPEQTAPEWALEFTTDGERNVWDSIDDFSVLDGTVLAIDTRGGFLLIRRADGVEVQARRKQLGDDSLSPSECCLLNDYYVQLFQHYPSAQRTFMVKPDTETLSTEALHFRWSIVSERLSEAVRFQQLLVARAHGRRRPRSPESEASPRRVLLYFGSQKVLSYAAVEGRLVVVLQDPGRTLVVCFDLQSGQMLWSRDIGEVVRLGFGYGMRVTGGVVNLGFHRTASAALGGDEHAALDLAAGRLLWQEANRGFLPVVAWEQGGGRLLLLRRGSHFPEQSGQLTLIEEKSGKEIWTVRAPEWRQFGHGLTQSRGEVFVPFTKPRWLLPPPEDIPAWEKLVREEPWAAEAQKDPLTHGVMCYSLSDGRLKATYALDAGRLPGAPRDNPPEHKHWAGIRWFGEYVPSPAIVTEDLVILASLVLSWKDVPTRSTAETRAVGVFSRESGQLLDVLWAPTIVMAERRGLTKAVKMEVHGNELFLLTLDGRLCCFELPEPKQMPAAED